MSGFEESALVMGVSELWVYNLVGLELQVPFSAIFCQQCPVIANIEFQEFQTV